MELSQQLELLLTKPGSGGKIGDGDLKIISDLLKRVNELERQFKEFMRKTNLEHIISEIQQIKNQLKNKADIADINEIKETLENFKKQFEYIFDTLKKLSEGHSINRKDIDDLINKVENLMSQMEQIKKLYNILNNKNDVPSKTQSVDMNDYVSVNVFNEYCQKTDDKLDDIYKEIDKLNKLIQSILDQLNNGSDLDLEKVKELIQYKANEILNACNIKFVDRNEFQAIINKINEKLKRLYDLINKKNNEHDHDAESWLLAKKPLQGFSCASCEAYIGDLKSPDQYIPWNKYPLRDPNDKAYRIGNGYSKLLQMMYLEKRNDPEIVESNENDPSPGHIKSQDIKKLGYKTAMNFKNKNFHNSEIERSNFGDLPKLNKKGSSNNLNEENTKEEKPNKIAPPVSATMYILYNNYI